MRVVFIHGACVQDGTWWWHRVADLLEGHGISSLAPALPSCGETGALVGYGGPGLTDDVAAVRRVLEDSAEPTIVVAHSYGGIVAAEAAAGVDAVNNIVLIASYLPEVGQSLSDFGGEAPAPFLDADVVEGTFGVRLDMLTDTFLHDCKPSIQGQAALRLARQSLQVTGQPVVAAAWKNVPTLYVVCAEDRGTPAALQREFAAKAGKVVELDSGHHPFLSQPDAVRDLLLGLL